MLYESIDPNCEGEQIRLAHCCDCAYTGNKGMWKGTVSIEGILTAPLEGIVELDNSDTWDCDDLIEATKKQLILQGEVTDFSGEANCPICGSPNFY